MLLTTQQLEEADQLADRIAVVDRGRVIAEGTSAQLKTKVGGERVQLTVAQQSDLGVARDVLGPGPTGYRTSTRTRGRSRPRWTAEPAGCRRSCASSDAAGVLLDDIGIRRPSLDDVFLTLTGRTAVSAAENEAVAARPKARRSSHDRHIPAHRRRAGGAPV